MKYKVLITAPPILPKVSKYKDLFNSKDVDIVIPEYDVTESLNEEQLSELLIDIDGILCGDDSLSESVIKSANKLKVISKWGTGIDSINTKAAKENGIEVQRVADIFGPPVSETVIGYILLFNRNLIEKDNVVRENRWSKVKSFLMSEKTLGIVGLGHIGQQVAKKALSFGMKVQFFDIKDIEIPNEINLINKVSFDELLQTSDFLSIHCDLNKTSHKLFKEKEFSKMKDSSIIINTARGQIIDEVSLIDALKNGLIGGAALDVFEEEPLASTSELKGFKNVIFSPHNSNGSPLIFNKVDELAIKNIFKVLGI